MKYPMTSQWYVAKTPHWYVSTMSMRNVVMTSKGYVPRTSHWYIPPTSQTTLKWNTQWRLSGTLARRLTVMSPRCYRGTSWQRLKDTSLGRHNGTSLRRPKQVSNETPNDVSVMRRQDVWLVHLQDVLEERRGDFLRKRNCDVIGLSILHLKQVLNETPNDVSKISIIRPKNVLVACPKVPKFIWYLPEGK